MLNYDVLSKQPAVFRCFSGIEVHEFDALNLKIKERYGDFEQKRLSRGDRKRAVGAGHPFKLPLASRLLMLLMYYRLYVSSNLLSYLFDLSQTSVLKDIRKLEPLVSEVLPLPKKQYDRALCVIYKKCRLRENSKIGEACWNVDAEEGLSLLKEAISCLCESSFSQFV